MADAVSCDERLLDTIDSMDDIKPTHTEAYALFNKEK